ncbi:hypothetical protein ACQR53_14090 [Xanthomonas oryzae]|uniref:hypothetical protein n=1 Tax=Xanthomonas oryzae TaxID=347 RepID=UPI003D16785E
MDVVWGFFRGDELSAEELMIVGGGMGAMTHSATGKVMSGGDWEASATIDW